MKRKKHKKGHSKKVSPSNLSQRVSAAEKKIQALRESSKLPD